MRDHEIQNNLQLESNINVNISKTLYPAMNWVVLVESDLSRQYAMKTHVIELCQSLSTFDQVTLLSHDIGPADNFLFSARKIDSRAYRPHNLSQITNTISAYSTLQKLSESQKVDVLYIRATAFGLGPLFFARHKEIAAFLEINGAWSAEQALSRSRFSIWKRFWVAPIHWLRAASINLACRLAGKIIVVTPQLATYLRDKGIPEDKIWIVPNGVNVSEFRPKETLAIRQQLGLDTRAQIIGYAGSLAAWQGVETLIQAFAEIPSEAESLRRLMIVGDGAEHSRLLECAQATGCADRVDFLGFQPYDQIPNFLNACDLLVAPKLALSSGFSTLKVFEYMACGRPVVASDLPGLEIVEQARAGLLFKTQDPRDLCAKLSLVLNASPAERAAMGQNARLWVEQNATWELAAERIRNLVSI